MADPWRTLYCNAHAGHREVMPCYARFGPAYMKRDGTLVYSHGNGYGGPLGLGWSVEAFDLFRRHRDHYGDRVVSGVDPASALAAVTAVASWLRPIHREPPPNHANRRIPGEAPWGQLFNVANVAAEDRRWVLFSSGKGFGKLAAYADDPVVFRPGRHCWSAAARHLNMIGLGPAPGMPWRHFLDVGAVCWQHALTSPDFAPPGGWEAYGGCE